MKNLLLTVLIVVGTLASNKAFATEKIPKVDFMTRLLASKGISNIPNKKSVLQTTTRPNSLIPYHATSDRDGLFPGQTVGQSKFKFYLLERINSLFIPKLPIFSKQSTINNTRPQEIPLPSAKSLVKNQKISNYPTINRSSLMVNSPDSKILSQKLSFVNPAPETKQVTSSFGWRIRPFSGHRQFHKGIDYGAPLGSPVVAAGDGIVTKVVSGCTDFRNLYCGQQFGNRIEIYHGNGAIATYGHLLNNSIMIAEGTKVWKNQEIARVGSSGWSSGAHLDFRVEVNGEFQDPTKYVQ